MYTLKPSLFCVPVTGVPFYFCDVDEVVISLRLHCKPFFGKLALMFDSLN